MAGKSLPTSSWNFALEIPFLKTFLPGITPTLILPIHVLPSRKFKLFVKSQSYMYSCHHTSAFREAVGFPKFRRPTINVLRRSSLCSRYEKEGLWSFGMVKSVLFFSFWHMILNEPYMYFFSFLDEGLLTKQQGPPAKPLTSSAFCWGWEEGTHYIQVPQTTSWQDGDLKQPAVRTERNTVDHPGAPFPTWCAVGQETRRAWFPSPVWKDKGEKHEWSWCWNSWRQSVSGDPNGDKDFLFRRGNTCRHVMGKRELSSFSHVHVLNMLNPCSQS